MQQAAQGGPARYAHFVNAMSRRLEENWVGIGRQLNLQWQQRDRNGTPEWHAVCALCDQSVAVTSKADQGYTWTLGELLSLAVAHCEQRHRENMR